MITRDSECRPHPGGRGRLDSHLEHILSYCECIIVPALGNVDPPPPSGMARKTLPLHNRSQESAILTVITRALHC